MAPTTEEIVEEEQRQHEAAQNGNGNGRSLEDQAREGMDADDDEDDGTPQLVLPGTGSRLSGSVGGKRPTESFFKMSGVSLPIAGQVQMEKDTEVWVAVPVAIDDVRVHNRRKNGEIVAVSRTHLARAVGQPVILEHDPTG